jgi:hypothetical protein
MDLLIGILSAAIAAIISLIVALISFMATRNTLRSEREKTERGLQRNMTEKLYDLRMEIYPEAIAITNGLRKSTLTELGDTLSEAYLKAIQEKLDEWHNAKAFLILSRPAVEELYALRRALREKPAPDGKYSPEQLERISKAKNAFRRSLRSDIQLLYEEEMESGEF